MFDQLLALRAFVRITEAGSFAKAADSLNMPRSTISKLLQDLESHLSVKLLERTTRAVTITPEGAAYHERALRLLGDLEDMDNGVATARDRPQGLLRISIGSILANLILIPRLAEFQERYPDIELQLGVSDRAVDIVSEGVDCVIRGGALPDSSFIAKRLCELDYITCAAPAYLASRSVPLSPDDIKLSHRVVSYYSALTGKPFALRFSRNGELVEFTQPTGVAVNDSTAHLNSLLEGLGIGQTFGFMARPHLASGRLVQLLPEWTQGHHTLNLVYPANRFPNLKLRVFQDWASEIFAPYDVKAS